MLWDFKPQFKINFILKRTSAPLYDPEGHCDLSAPLWETLKKMTVASGFAHLWWVSQLLTAYMQIRDAEEGNQQRQSGYSDDRSWAKSGESGGCRRHFSQTIPQSKMSLGDWEWGDVHVQQSCPTLRDPHGLYSPWNSLGQNTGVGNHPFSRRSSQPRDQT